MNKTKPIYWKLLIAAVVIYIIATSVMLGDMYSKIGKIEHALVHEGAAHSEH